MFWCFFDVFDLSRFPKNCRLEKVLRFCHQIEQKVRNEYPLIQSP